MFFFWSSPATFWCWGTVSLSGLSRSIHTSSLCFHKCVMQLRMPCSVYHRCELLYCSGHVVVSLHDILASMIGLYHPVALNFRTRLRLILCCLYKNLTDCIEYCEFRIADLLFITSFLKVLSKWSKYCEKKPKTFVNYALLRRCQLILKVLGQTCTAIYESTWVTLVSLQDVFAFTVGL